MSLATDLEMLQVLKEIRDLLKAQAPVKPVEPFPLPDLNKFDEYLRAMPKLANPFEERCTDGGSHRYDGACSIAPQPCSKCGKASSLVIPYNEDMTPKG